MLLSMAMVVLTSLACHRVGDTLTVAVPISSLRPL